MFDDMNFVILYLKQDPLVGLPEREEEREIHAKIELERQGTIEIKGKR